MALVTASRQGTTVVLTYANPPFGTMTAAGSTEMSHALKAAVDDPAVRAIVITGGVPGIFIRHYDVDELFAMSEALRGPPPEDRGGPRDPGYLEMVDLVAAAPKP